MYVKYDVHNYFFKNLDVQTVINDQHLFGKYIQFIRKPHLSEFNQNHKKKCHKLLLKQEN